MQYSLLVLAQGALVLALTYSVPSSPPSNSSPQLSPAPVGISFEFFTFPAYFNDVASTAQCLQNLKDLSGTWPPIRIGGTTQDRATYTASSSQAVTYTVASPADAPAALTFGPSFMSLAATYAGNVTIGLNRRLNQLANTVAAAEVAYSNMPNLRSIELGNEPNFWSSSDPIAGNAAWSGARDIPSQLSWQKAVAGNLSAANIISAGVYFGTGSYSIPDLASSEGSSLAYVNNFCSHNYPQGSGNYNLTSLMSHSQIASQISQFSAGISASHQQDKPYLMGETNSATQGGGGISPTFGAALWILDYVMQSVIMGMESLYFHQGTIGNCQYCWWGRYSMGAPYYGAYFAAMTLANADRIAPLDTASNPYAAYAVYKDNQPVRVLLYNSNYYTSGPRSSQNFTLNGISTSTVTAKRLTAPSATSRQDQGGNPSIAGQVFANGTCVIQGAQTLESTNVVNSSATFTVAASEALLIYL